MNPNQLKRQLGISYLGGCNSPKLIKSMGRNVMTYGVYLAPHNISGYSVCPESCNCSKYCLHGSGRNKIELLTFKGGGPIQKSRIKKTKLFFEDRPAFMSLLTHEIDKAIIQAKESGLQLAIRLNCISDINLEEFVLDGRNILQLYPDLQFYDYTKVLEHTKLAEKYSNYDLTFSYSGENWSDCDMLLKKGYRVAAVFGEELPGTFRGYPVINANDDDARFLDGGGLICGLTYKKVANDYVNGRYQRPDTTFINCRSESISA
ncbi:hypothetical protein IR083_07835 [Dysgonomonas sp. GY75]|uniref:GP88 family protein n=1 Tax=Dysgonomonas sp. GY75 TaxID=2780419 RepID=UPI00188326D1|nr:hypothetical protein [Dysgonomonas sp. GY75]MBF0648727.1 hypothetical protein [Dysgonomonas sp. GY75]